MCFVCSNKTIKQNMNRVKELESSINILEIKCPTLRDCKWKGQLSQAAIHLTGCLHFLVKCNQCDQIFPRGNRNEHDANSCPKRKVKCEFCDKQGSHNNLEKHLQVCRKHPILCLNECGINFPKDELPEHRSKCELEEITCPYTQYGCDTKPMMRRDLSAHKKEYIVEHTDMSLVEIKQLREINNELIWRVKGMKELDGVDCEIKNVDKLEYDAEIEGPAFYVNNYKLKIYFTVHIRLISKYIKFHLKRIEGEFDRNLGESYINKYRLILINKTDYKESYFSDGQMRHQLVIGNSSEEIIVYEGWYHRRYLTADNSLFIRLYFDTNNTTPLRSLSHEETPIILFESLDLGSFLMPRSQDPFA